MFGNHKTPLYFFLLITDHKEVVFVQSEHGWTLPGRVGYQIHPDDVFIREKLTRFTTRLSLSDKIYLHREEEFKAMESVYECHVYGFRVSIEVKPEYLEKDIWLSREDTVVSHALHEHARWVMHIPSVKSRLT